jgi:hypothetical protein
MMTFPRRTKELQSAIFRGFIRAAIRKRSWRVQELKDWPNDERLALGGASWKLRGSSRRVLPFVGLRLVQQMLAHGLAVEAEFVGDGRHTPSLLLQVAYVHKILQVEHWAPWSAQRFHTWGFFDRRYRGIFNRRFWGILDRP